MYLHEFRLPCANMKFNTMRFSVKKGITRTLKISYMNEEIHYTGVTPLVTVPGDTTELLPFTLSLLRVLAYRIND